MSVEHRITLAAAVGVQPASETPQTDAPVTEIGEAGTSAVVVLEHADCATYGTLRPGENGSLQLTLTGGELLVPDAGIVLTRDADVPATKPRQGVR